jgi:Na+/H+ antiporter NhaA
MPVFALANAGVALGTSTAAATSPISLGIVHSHPNTCRSVRLI